MGRSMWDDHGDVRTDLSDREVTRKVVWIFIAVVTGCAVLLFASWGIGIFTAPWVGRQNVHRIINSPNNIIGQNDTFYQLNGDIATDVANLKTEEAAVAVHLKEYPSGSPDPVGANAAEQSRLESVVTGTSANCAQDVQEYNNNARNYTKAAFRSANLPAQQDPTQCEVSQ